MTGLEAVKEALSKIERGETVKVSGFSRRVTVVAKSDLLEFYEGDLGERTYFAVVGISQHLHDIFKNETDALVRTMPLMVRK